jgi:Arc/MetJ-type ribon-helix-helix transcriptional regulator
MPYQFPPDLDLLVRQQMALGNYESEDELLRVALESLSAEASDLEAVCDALDELASGDQGISLDEAMDRIRTEHRVAPDP